MHSYLHRKHPLGSSHLCLRQKLEPSSRLQSFPFSYFPALQLQMTNARQHRRPKEPRQFYRSMDSRLRLGPSPFPSYQLRDEGNTLQYGESFGCQSDRPWLGYEQYSFQQECHLGRAPCATQGLFLLPSEHRRGWYKVFVRQQLWGLQLDLALLRRALM